MRLYRSQRRAKLKNDQKANEPLQEAGSFLVKRRAFCERILRRSHIVAQKISAHIAQYASVLRRSGKYCRAHIYFRAHLTFNAVRPPVLLSFYPCKVYASVNVPALFSPASAFLPALICFFRWCACIRKVFLGSFHFFSPLYSRVHSCFLRYQKDAELFLCVLCPRVIRVWSRMVDFWRNFLKNSQIFCLDPPGNPCSLLFCRFLCIFALRQW